MILHALTAHQTPNLRSYKATSSTAWRYSEYRCVLIQLFTFLFNVNQSLSEKTPVWIKKSIWYQLLASWSRRNTCCTALMLYGHSFKAVFCLVSWGFGTPLSKEPTTGKIFCGLFPLKCQYHQLSVCIQHWTCNLKSLPLCGTFHVVIFLHKTFQQHLYLDICNWNSERVPVHAMKV